MVYQDLKAYRKIGGNKTFVDSIKHLKPRHFALLLLTCLEGHIIVYQNLISL